MQRIVNAAASRVAYWNRDDGDVVMALRLRSLLLFVWVTVI